MIKVTILIPTTFNNGKPAPSVVLDAFRNNLLEICGGFTYDGIATGSCENDSGGIHIDQCHKLWVVCESTLLPQLRCLARQIARDLNQETVYLEWAETNVEFIDQRSL